MTELATVGLSRAAGRPTIDRTGLTGAFDWTLVWTPDNLPPRAPSTPPDQPILVNGIAIDPNGPSASDGSSGTARLRLQPAVGPIDVIVIDRIDHPTPN